MKFRIHYEVETPEGLLEDSIDISGDTHVEIWGKASEEIEKRKGKNYWSEKIE